MASGDGHTKGVPTHDVKYVLYNTYGNSFEVPAKYVTPLWSIGRGAYESPETTLPSQLS